MEIIQEVVVVGHMETKNIKVSIIKVMEIIIKEHLMEIMIIRVV